MRSAPAAASVAIAAALVLAGCGNESGPPEPIPRDRLGVNAQYVRELSTDGQAGAADAHLGEIAKLGFGFVRANVDWAGLEPVPPVHGRAHYDYSGADAWVSQLAERGLRWQPTAIGISTPAWARAPVAAAQCGERAPPRPRAFAEMLAGLARRYGAGGGFWRRNPSLEARPITDFEVWNEPNFAPFWCPVPDPAAYARLYAAARRAVESSDERARVLVGGLASFTYSGSAAGLPARTAAGEFVAAMVAARPSLAEEVEGVAFHPYGRDPAEVLARVEGFLASMASAGIEAPLAINEIGWPTAGEGAISEEQRATYLAELATALPAICDIAAIVPHTWITPEGDPANAEDWFGLADPQTAVPYPSILAFSQASRSASAPPEGCEG